MKLRHRNSKRAALIRQQSRESYGQIVLIEVPKRPVDPPPFVGPKEPNSVSGFLRRWIQYVQSSEGKPEYATSLNDLASRGALIGNLDHRSYKAFRRGRLKICQGAYPKAIQETQRTTSEDLVITQNFSYNLVFEG